MNTSFRPGWSGLRAVGTSIAFASCVLLGACSAEEVPVEEGEASESDLTRVNDADKSVDITWACASNRPDVSGLNSQEEYCEWTRRSRNPGGALQCDFNSNFDATRPYFLTQNEGNSSYPETFANSQQFLVGGTEPSGATRVGIVPSCVAQQGACIAPDCVCGRKSDPQICAVLGSFARNKCAPEVAAYSQVTAGRPVGGQERQPIVAVQLQIPRNLEKNCFYKAQRTAAGQDVNVPGVDPAKEKTYVRCFFDSKAMPNIQRCDDVARSITAGARVRVKNAGACNFARLKAELDGKTPNACR
jgi:hypothetical protein